MILKNFNSFKYSLEKSQSQCISVESVSVNSVFLLQHFQLFHLMDFKSTKKAGFPISTVDCIYAFCTSGTFYTGD